MNNNENPGAAFLKFDENVERQPKSVGHRD